ncbi:MAG: histidine phosphatase family protein [Sulfitobacter sp.]
MLRLILMRHAKSDWSAGPSSDHDRPLNPRGRLAAAELGAWLRAQRLIPDQILCSTSIRTRETCLRLNLPQDIPTTDRKQLYLASADDVLAVLKTATGQTVLMIAHNPGIGVMAEQITSHRPEHPKFRQFPSGATLVADFDLPNWGSAGWGNAIAQHFIVPRDL